MSTSSLQRRLFWVVLATFLLMAAAAVQSAVALTPQTVTWTPSAISTNASGTMYPDVLATSSGSGAISYQVVSDGGSGCTVNSSTAVINSTSAGACRVRATAAATGTEASGFAEATFYFRNTQTVTWSPTNLTNAIGTVTPNAVATTDGGGAITYSVYNAGTTGCTMVGSSIQATAVGVCVIRAVAAETDTRFFGAATASFTFTGTQTVTWYANNNLASLASSPLTPNALASSTANTAISYAVQDAGLTGCSVNASTAVVTAASNGLCVIRATAAANTYYPAAFVDKTFTFNINQTLTWNPTTTLLISGSTITPSSLATSSGTGAISYWVDSFSTTAGCSVNSSTGVITAWNVGSCVIIASAAAGNGFNYASRSVTFTLTKVQTLTWTPATVDLQLSSSPFSGTAAATSDGTGSISYQVQSAGGTGCSINSSNRSISFTALGSCVIRASAAASGNWLSGYVDVTFSIVSSQSVSWMGANVTQTSGTYTPSQATASGGGIIDYSVVSSGATGCAVDASTGVITFSAIGQCQVRATARASGYYTAGGFTQVNFNFYSNQTVTWAPTNTTNPFSGGIVTPNAAATSNGPGAITYSLAIPNASCTLNTSSGAISSSVRGRCYVRANSAATGYYNGASSSMITFTFTGPQTVTWAATNISNQVTHSVTANVLPVSNGGPISYSVASAGTAGCSVDATTGVIAATAIGTCTIRATAAAFLTYQSGFADLTFTFVEGQLITWPVTNTSNPDSIGTVTPDALASSNLASAITYSVQSAGTTGCTVNSSTAVITAASAGVCVIRATAAASGNVGSDYRDLSFTFNSPSMSVASTGSGIYLTAWNSRAVLAGTGSKFSIFGYGFTSDATVTIAGKTFAPKVSSANELTFELPKLEAGKHSFVIVFGSIATVSFVDVLEVISSAPTVTIVTSGSAATSHATVVRAEKTFSTLIKKVDLPAQLVCTAYLPSNSSAKNRLDTMTSTKRMCNQMASKVGAKVATAKMSVSAEGSQMVRKITLAINF